MDFVFFISGIQLHNSWAVSSNPYLNIDPNPTCRSIWLNCAAFYHQESRYHANLGHHKIITSKLSDRFNLDDCEKDVLINL